MRKKDNDEQQLPNETGKFASRVEFIAIKDQIPGLVEKGYSYRAIHEFFTKKGIVTMKYMTFCKYAKRMMEGEFPSFRGRTTNKAIGADEKVKDFRPKQGPVHIGKKDEPEKPSDLDTNNCV